MPIHAALPSESDAVAVVRQYLGTGVRSVHRFPTGFSHYVFDVLTDDGRAVVVRLTPPTTAALFRQALEWYGYLVPLGIPLARVLAHNVAPEGDTFPFMVLARLPGRDLAEEYGAMSSAQRRVLAEGMAQVQRQVATLPPGPGYGFTTSYTGPAPHRRWIEVLVAQLERSRDRITRAGLLAPEVVDPVLAALERFESYFDAIPATPFLDDTTTKNVIVHEGRLSGIVDVDWMCFGDRLFTVGLTLTALLAHHEDPEYAGFWLDALEATPLQRRVVSLYAALFCAGFLSEFGTVFNRVEGIAANPGQIEHLQRVLAGLLAKL